jgi:hypothetical protein
MEKKNWNVKKTLTNINYTWLIGVIFVVMMA